jgi:hypothetical protein
MTSDIPNNSPTPSTTDDLTESYEPDPIVVPVRDILDGVVGSMTGVEIGRMDSETLAWAGVRDGEPAVGNDADDRRGGRRERD